MNSYKVVADYIDERQFSFLCPICSTTEKVNRHTHGNCLDYCYNRWEHRGGHGDCMGKDFLILICKDTKRVLNRHHKRIYQKYLEDNQEQIQANN